MELSRARKNIGRRETLTNKPKLMSNAVVLQDMDSVEMEDPDMILVHLTQQFKVQDFFFEEELGFLPTMPCSSCQKLTQNCHD